MAERGGFVSHRAQSNAQLTDYTFPRLLNLPRLPGCLAPFHTTGRWGEAASGGTRPSEFTRAIRFATNPAGSSQGRVEIFLTGIDLVPLPVAIKTAPTTLASSLFPLNNEPKEVFGSDQMEPTKKDVKAQDSVAIRHRQPYWAYMNGQRAGTVHMNYVHDVHA